MVFGSGRRTVDVRGGVIDEAIVPLEGSIPAPARFTVTYDRGNQNRQVLDIEIDLFLSTVGAVRMQGVEGRLSALQTDLPGASLPDAGQPIRLSIPNCRTRTCSRTFHVGGTLNVTRGPGGGASLVIPIPIYADLVSDDRQRR